MLESLATLEPVWAHEILNYPKYPEYNIQTLVTIPSSASTMSQSEEDVSESGSEESSEFDTDVIDWDEAMEQCGDDEDFLRELLADLRGEISAQLEKIDDSLEVRTTTAVDTQKTFLSEGLKCCKAIVLYSARLVATTLY